MKHTNSFFKSFVHAHNGLQCASSERNVRLHLTATVCVLISAYIVQLHMIEWALVLSAIVFVLITEFFNTCIEMLCDIITTDYSIQIKNIKDIAAASVVLSAAYALAIAFLILYPKISHYIFNLLYI
jgi:diacylglycerol kinase